MSKRSAITTPRKLGRPPAADSAETRERLLRVAQLAFAQVGYAATTNRDMATQVDITTAAIYHYFLSKAELYMAVFDQVDDIVYSAFEKAAAAEESFFERFSAVLDAAVELNREDPSLAAFIVAVPSEARRHPELADMLRPKMTRSNAFLRRLVIDARERGELAPGIDERALEDLLNAVLSGLANLNNTTGSVERHRRAVEVLKRFMVGAALVMPPRD
ncbi:MAG: TetR/AcrR family transcriptional regulator [Acidimicrobiia bacterium]